MKLYHTQNHPDEYRLDVSPVYEYKVIKAQILNNHQHLDYIYVHINKEFIQDIAYHGDQKVGKVTPSLELIASKLLLVPKPWKMHYH